MRSIFPSLLAPLSTSLLIPHSVRSFSVMFGSRVSIISQQKFLSSVSLRRSRGSSSSKGWMPVSVGIPSVTAKEKRMLEARRLWMSDSLDPANSHPSISREKLKEILAVYTSREESGVVVIDVRGEEEVVATGKISPVAETLPLPYIQQHRALAMDEQDFLDNFGFEKPRFDETIIFSCKAGIRSRVACQIARMEGYTDVINYTGGANEWFSS